jgi:inositol phosphorylceramide mannosyltransferase catalytic subunit
MKERKT